MSIDVEYAIKKDIRNNPIVREIDWQQKQEFLRTVCLAGFIVAMLLFWACQQLEIVNSGYALSSLRKDQATEDALNRQLRLEVETLRAPQRIEHLAVQELHMAEPGPGRTLIIERATAPIASRAIVATTR
jgi:cell division protein FtsL